MRSDASSAVSAAFRARQSAFFGAAVLLCVAVCTAGIDPPDLAHTSKSVLSAMGTGLLHPDWRFFFGTGKDGLGWLLLETVGIALAGTGLGALLAAPLAFLSTPKLLPRPVALLFRVLIVAIRSVPFLIYGLIFIRVSGPGAFTGVLTLAVCSIGLLSKRFTEAIEALVFAPMTRCAPWGYRFCRASAMRCCRSSLRRSLQRCCTGSMSTSSEASVLGLVGAGGIGAPAHLCHEQVCVERCERNLPRLRAARLGHRRGQRAPAAQAQCRLPPLNNGFRFARFLINFLFSREESPDYGTLLLL